MGTKSTKDAAVELVKQLQTVADQSPLPVTPSGRASKRAWNAVADKTALCCWGYGYHLLLLSGVRGKVSLRCFKGNVQF